MGAVLVHIDLEGDRPHPSSLAALAAGRAVASSWGATLYAALVVHDHDAAKRPAPDATGQIVTNSRAFGVEAIQTTLARAGADKVVVAVSDAPVAPLWAAIGGAWQGVLDQLRPRLVLFGVDAPAADELAPRTGAKIGARLLLRARATGGDQIELRDRDGGYVRASDGGAAVALIAAGQPFTRGDDDIDLLVLVLPGGADPRVELAGTVPAELMYTSAPVIALGDDVVADAEVVGGARRLASQLGAHVVGGPAAVRAGAIAPNAVIEKTTPLAPELCVAVGSATVDLAGTTSLVRIGGTSTKGVDAALAGLPGAALGELVRVLEGQ